jgi:hypothetical protein
MISATCLMNPGTLDNYKSLQFEFFSICVISADVKLEAHIPVSFGWVAYCIRILAFTSERKLD